MNAVFADTFFWIAFTNVQDQAQERAKSFARSAAPSAIIFTTEEVLTEYLNYFAGRGLKFRERAALNVESILENPTVRVLGQTSGSFQAGLTLYRARLDKGYSLTDCVPMEAMRSEGIIDVLTNDAHFEQEGFRAIFRESWS
jgi:predicted nucleic acid-binding protein